MHSFSSSKHVFFPQQSPSLGEHYNDTFGIRTGGSSDFTKSGEVYLKGELDYETNTYYQFIVYAIVSIFLCYLQTFVVA